MATQSLQFFDLSTISTDDPDGFSDNGGYQFDLGSSHVTIADGATEQSISVEDDDSYFDDDDLGQTLTTGQTLNGTPYSAGTIIESEYEIVVRDSLGNDYVLQFVSADGDAYNIVGFIIQGANPPFGEPLTVVGRSDGVSGTYAYSTSSPACFAPQTRILTERGQVRARDLRVGDVAVLADGGRGRIELVLTTDAPPAEGADTLPVRIRAGAFGRAMPRHDLVLSPQHRVYVPALGALVPARALTVLPRIGLLKTRQVPKLVHIVLASHSVLIAEGHPCESFWPGPSAMAQLPEHARGLVRGIMGPAPARAMPFLRMQAAIAALLQADSPVAPAAPAEDKRVA
ncbi:Hint domain-containing protein [Pseudooceanicola sp. C21-150M6]|uniref:Hint domain-containing protein n=1 Tax=Pseudooceanicola sp. C21-150M6 TaxID=3434355 RepID=UPI003D7F635F